MISEMPRLRKGDLMINSQSDSPITGLLIKRKGNYWHYLLTSLGTANYNKDKVVTSYQKVTRETLERSWMNKMIILVRNGDVL